MVCPDASVGAGVSCAHAERSVSVQIRTVKWAPHWSVSWHSDAKHTRSGCDGARQVCAKGVSLPIGGVLRPPPRGAGACMAGIQWLLCRDPPPARRPVRGGVEPMTSRKMRGVSSSVLSTGLRHAACNRDRLLPSRLWFAERETVPYGWVSATHRTSDRARAHRE